MSTETNRRIAVEIMGEPEPTEHPLEAAPRSYKGWRRGSYVPQFGAPIEWYWKHKPFSEDLDLATQAADRYFAEFQPHDDEHHAELFMAYRFDANDSYEASLDEKVATARTLPEAICKLLLALVEDSERTDAGGV